MEKSKKRYSILLALLILVVIINIIAIFICFYRVKALEYTIGELQSYSADGQFVKGDISEKDVYILMYDNLKDSNEKIINTVYWALGAIGATIFGIIGANVFYNFNINKKEIERISDNLKLSTDEMRVEMYEKIQLKFEEYIQKSSDKLNSDFLNFKQTNDSQLQLSLDKMGFDINNIVKKVDDNYSNQIIRKKSTDEYIERKFAESDIKIYNIEAYIWTAKQVYSNVLICYMRKAIKEIEIGFNVEYTLNDICETLNMTKDISYCYTEIEEFINKIPTSNQIQKELIIKLVKNIGDSKLL